MLKQDGYILNHNFCFLPITLLSKFAEGTTKKKKRTYLDAPSVKRNVLVSIKEQNPNQIKRNAIEDNTRNLFRLRKKNNTIIDEIIRDIENLFESDGEDYYEPVSIADNIDNDYIKYESESSEN